MNRRGFRASMWIGTLALLGLYACEMSAPERVLRAPVIRAVSPTSQLIDVLVGDTLSFSVGAVDPDEGDLEYRFTIGDSTVAWGPIFDYIVPDTGTVYLTAHVSNGGGEATVGWQINRFLPENQPPYVVDFDPPERSPRVTLGESIRFSMTAADPEGEPLSYIITLNDSIVSASNRYLFIASDVGEHEVKAVATDGEAFTVHLWRLTVLAEPDSVLPAAVDLLSLVTGNSPGDLIVTFVAVGEDSMEGTPSGYLIRTASSPIVDEDTWASASGRPGPIVPPPPGAIQKLVVGSLKPANFVWVAIRAVDDFGNLSPLGPTLGAWTKGMEVYGTVRDAMTGAPAPGIEVALAGLADTTGVDGRFALTELPDGVHTMTLRDESDANAYGAYYDVETPPYRTHHGDDFDLWVIPDVPLETQHYESFLMFLLEMTGSFSSENYFLRTWNWPVDVYVQPFEHNGLDFAQIMRDGLADWENRVGLDLFTLVSAEPDTGVVIDYSGLISRDFYVVELADAQLLPVKGRITMRTVYTPDLLHVFQRVASHEIGHALGMRHSRDAKHLMVAGSTPPVAWPTRDELALARVMTHLPRGHRLDIHLFD